MGLTKTRATEDTMDDPREVHSLQLRLNAFGRKSHVGRQFVRGRGTAIGIFLLGLPLWGPWLMGEGIRARYGEWLLYLATTAVGTALLVGVSTSARRAASDLSTHDPASIALQKGSSWDVDAVGRVHSNERRGERSDWVCAISAHRATIVDDSDAALERIRCPWVGTSRCFAMFSITGLLSCGFLVGFSSVHLRGKVL